MPPTVTVLLPLPTFLSVNAKMPPLMLSLPKSVPLVTVAVPSALRPAS